MGAKQVQKLIKDALGAELKANGFIAHNNGMWYRLDNGLLYRFGYCANFLCFEIDPLFYHIMFEGGMSRAIMLLQDTHPDINTNLMMLGSPFVKEEKMTEELIDIWHDCIKPDMDANTDVEAFVRNDVATARNLQQQLPDAKSALYPLPLQELARGSLNSMRNMKNALIYLHEFDLLEKELLKECVFTYNTYLRQFAKNYGSEASNNPMYQSLIEQDIGKAIIGMQQQINSSLERTLKIMPAVENRDIAALYALLDDQRGKNIAYLEQFWPKRSPMPAWVHEPLMK